MRLKPLAFAVSATALLASGAVMAAPKSTTKTANAQAATAWTPPADPYIWLEDVNGEKPMAWVKAENAKTLAVLEKDPRFDGLYQDAVKIAEAKDKIAYPSFLGGAIYNFWQDADHTQGIWRKTSFEDYAKPAPAWTTVIDVDALSKAEGKHWVWEGADCLRPAERLCLVNLSDGGEDAVTVREFDLQTGAFVEGGFVLPKSKQDFAWEDQDHLLVARDWGPGSMTESGYAYIVKRVTRGQSLDKAVEVFRGTPKDVSVRSFELRDGAGNHVLMIDRGVSFFESEVYLLTPTGVKKLGLPLKASLHGMVDGRILVEPKIDWTAGGKTWKAGMLVSVNLKDVQADPAHLKPTLVYAPGPRESVAGIASTKDRLVIGTYENVRGRLHVYTPVKGGGWSHKKLDLPDNASVGVTAADEHSERAFVW
jgi:prolyl oligopeptidase